MNSFPFTVSELVIGQYLTLFLINAAGITALVALAVIPFITRLFMLLLLDLLLDLLLVAHKQLIFYKTKESNYNYDY